MARGFTLMELIIVMLVLAILAIGSSRYIGIGARMYSDASEREQLLSAGRFAAERLQRELREATPNSVRIATQAALHCIEFAPIISAGLVQQLPTAPDYQLRLLHSAWQDEFLQLPLSIYPQRSSDIYAPAANEGATLLLQHKVQQLQLEHTNLVALTLDAYVFNTNSPERRFYLLAASPVSYCFNALTKELRRYEAYAYQAEQPLPPLAPGILMAKQLAQVQFSAVPASLQRNNVVNIQLVFASEAGSDLFFNHKVQLYNVP